MFVAVTYVFAINSIVFTVIYPVIYGKHVRVCGIHVRVCDNLIRVSGYLHRVYDRFVRVCGIHVRGCDNLDRVSGYLHRDCRYLHRLRSKLPRDGV